MAAVARPLALMEAIGPVRTDHATDELLKGSTDPSSNTVFANNWRVAPSLTVPGIA